MIIANQNSNSPNIRVLSKLNANNNKIQAKAVIQLGICGTQNDTYLATAVTSAIPDTVQVNQYVHPVIKPASGPTYSLVMSANELNFVLDNNISPIARININNTKPTII